MPCDGLSPRAPVPTAPLLGLHGHVGVSPATTAPSMYTLRPALTDTPPWPAPSRPSRVPGSDSPAIRRAQAGSPGTCRYARALVSLTWKVTGWNVAYSTPGRPARTTAS